MQGFFSKTELDGLKVSGSVTRCSKCGLFQTCNTPRMEPSGGGRKGVLVLAEAPGETEDKKGVQLIGDAGRHLEQALRRLGVDLHEDCRLINSVNCRPPKNRTPTPQEVEACRAMVWTEIRRFKPKLILLLGNTALESFLGHRWQEDSGLGGIQRWRGYLIPDRAAECWVFATWHPSYMIRKQTDQALETLWMRDLKDALRGLKLPLPAWEDEEKLIQTTWDTAQAVKLLRAMRAHKPRLLAFDYETTGLKAQRDGHRICTVSLCATWDKAYAFPVDDAVREELAPLLEDPNIRKIASNIKFEDSWTVLRLGSQVRGWFWDTMIASRVLDQRKGTASIKFQAYVRYGLCNYGEEMAPFLHATGAAEKRDGGNAFNQIDKAPRQRLLVYNGLDSLMEYRVGHDQMRALGVTL